MSESSDFTPMEISLMPYGGPMQIVLEAIRESPSQPRKTYGPMDDLVDSVRRLGVLQPILVRPCEPTATSPAVFEVVFGHRRLRAAREAGLAQIPATIREMRDLEVLEAQLVENCHRADVHPLEEAEAYETLRDQHGFPVEEIAAKVGRSVSYVRQRMRLTALGKAGREAFYAGALTPATALLVARIPDAALQGKAVEAATGAPRRKGGPVEEPLTAAELRDYIAGELMMAMKTAPWALDDAELVPPAGPCTTCPKRTGNEPELFADLEKHDHCTDPPCYRSKLAAWGQQRLAEAKAAGRKVLTAKETKGVFGGAAASHGVVYVKHASGWQSLDDKDYSDSKMRTLRQLIGKVAEPVIAIAPTGQVVELVERKKVSALMKKAGHAKPKAAGDDRPGLSAKEKQRRAEERLEREIEATAESRIWEAAVSTVEGASLDANPTLLVTELRLIALAAIDDRLAFDWEICARAAQRRGLQDLATIRIDNLLGASLKDWVRSAGAPEQLLALLVELFFVTAAGYGCHAPIERELRGEALVTLGISETAITEAVRQEIKERAAQVEAAPAPTTKAKKKAATKGGE